MRIQCFSSSPERFVFCSFTACLDCRWVFPCWDWKHSSLKLAHFQKAAFPWYLYSYIIYFTNLLHLFHVLSGLLVALCSWGLTPTGPPGFMLSHSAVSHLQQCLFVWDSCLQLMSSLSCLTSHYPICPCPCPRPPLPVRNWTQDSAS